MDRQPTGMAFQMGITSFLTGYVQAASPSTPTWRWAGLNGYVLSACVTSNNAQTLCSIIPSGASKRKDAGTMTIKTIGNGDKKPRRFQKKSPGHTLNKCMKVTVYNSVADSETSSRKGVYSYEHEQGPDPRPHRDGERRAASSTSHRQGTQAVPQDPSELEIANGIVDGPRQIRNDTGEPGCGPRHDKRCERTFRQVMDEYLANAKAEAKKRKKKRKRTGQYTHADPLIKFLRERPSRLNYGVKIPGKVCPELTIKKLIARYNRGRNGRYGAALKNDQFYDHFASKVTHYFWADHCANTPEILVMIDADAGEAHGGGSTQGCWDFMEKVRQELFPGLYLE